MAAPLESLAQVYSSQSSLKTHSDRLNHLASSFKSLYGHPPHFFARAPGRVNIIGEHIDYCGFSVLPAAIEPDLVLACAVIYCPSSSSSADSLPSPHPVTVSLANLDPSYSSHQFTYTTSPISVPRCPQGGWVNYVKASLKTVLEEIPSVDLKCLPSSIDILFHGTLSAASGLSSSAALTTASVLAFLHIFSSTFDKGLIAQLAIQSERACGINVGGMDQTASVFGEPSKLLHMYTTSEFSSSTNVVPLAFPTVPATTFVIANSLVKSTKLVSAKFQYNLRVVECRIGTQLLAHALFPKASGNEISSLRDLIDRVEADGVMQAIESVLEKVLEKKVAGGEEGLTPEQVMDKLAIDQENFEKVIINGIEAEPIGGRYMVYNRLCHVLSESKRVYEFRSLLERSGEGSIQSMGDLMTASHESCRRDYDCSCPELDELVSIGRHSGSLGSRLTGAGWGGSSVHLVPDSKLDQFIGTLKTEYYDKKFPELDDQAFGRACFASKPGGGACVLEARHFI